MVMSRNQAAGTDHNVKIVYKSLERVEHFKYLGTTLTNLNSTHEEIKGKLKSGNACYHLVQNLLSSSLTFLFTYLLTPPRCRVLPEQLTGFQLVKKFPAFHGARRFITALTSVCYLSVSWASPIQSTCPHPTSFVFQSAIQNI